MMQHVHRFGLCALAAIAVATPAAAAATERGDTLLLSASGGTAGDASSSQPSISADGRFVAFMSAATNLHPDASSGAYQVLLSEPATGSLALISRADGIGGSAGNADSWDAVASADGRHVAFASMASNLHEDDPDAIWDVFLRDRDANQTFLLSRASGIDGVKGNGECWALSISADGRFVAFTSAADNLHPDDSDTMGDIYVRDLQSSQTTLVSRAGGSDGSTANSPATRPSISADGRYIAFDSQATNLHPDATDGSVWQVFLRDQATSETVLVSRADGASGNSGDDSSFTASVSANGRFVGFQSRAGNLDPDAVGGNDNVFVRDLARNETVLTSRASGTTGAPADSSAGQASISADGRFLAFGSNATNLHPDASDGEWQVYLRDVRGEVMIFEDRFEGDH